MTFDNDADAQTAGQFVGPQTFMNVPLSSAPTNSAVAVLGVPFDAGTSPTCVGSRTGPAAIREQSALLQCYQPPQTVTSPLEQLRVVDCGDVQLVPSMVDESFANTETAANSTWQAGVAPLAFGGDGMVSLPLLRAAHAVHPELAVIHIDTYRGDGPSVQQRYNTATTYTRAAEEGLIDPANSYHIGIRGTASQADVIDHTRSHGYNVITSKELFETAIEATAASFRDALAGKVAYFSFDMDFFDPSCAPGVCTPSWGGASAREGLGFLKDLSSIDFVAADINTVSPPHDVGGMTALLAATVAFEILTLFCASPSMAHW